MSLSPSQQPVKLYRVGGCVRDQYLDLQSHDIDYSVEAPSYDAMVDELWCQSAKIIYKKPEYLAVRARRYDGVICDFVLCRKDGYYHDGRRPENVTMGTIYDDLSRRDFTINAMAIDANDRLLDPHGGLEDLRRRMIRCVGSTDRLTEDALRMLRAIRFMIVLPNNFTLDSGIEKVLQDPNQIRLLAKISQDRIRDELDKCFRFDTIKTIEVLNQYPHIMQVVFTHIGGQGECLWLRPTSEKIKANQRQSIKTPIIG